MELNVIRAFIEENKEIFFYGGLALCVIYLGIILLKQTRKISQRNNAIEAAQRNYNQAINERNILKKELMEELTKDL